ncbi:unnamed protein product [Notodromas monacha]|uniref:Uncharacterized protein n=1 Tax=Notodromas monacha TaxID=399045 RepID=A0A7R9GC31_9CRUS|nr:unnamed protein product [Notodromas monacha]CAG0915577.1 unnamed protein product [Notodromas monacha]
METETMMPSPPTKSEGVRLKKELRLMEAVSVIVGLIVGTGIFVSPTGVLQETGSVGFAILVWVACGILSTMGAICYAELGTLIPVSGGDFAYIREAFGDFPSFLFIWDAVFVFVPTTNAIMALTFANYAMQPFYGTCEVPDDAKRLIAAIVICEFLEFHVSLFPTYFINLVSNSDAGFLTFLNCWNMKITKKVQDVFLITKISALVIVIIAGMTYLFMGHYESFQAPFENSSSSPSKIAVSFYQGMFSYAGYNYLNYMFEEVQNPFVNVPRAIYISMPLVTLLYVLANVAYLAVLPPSVMLASNAIAVTFGDKVLGIFSWIMPVFVAMSALGALSVHVMTSARICFKAASVGLLPDSMALVSLRKTPAVSLTFLGILSLCYLSTSQVSRLIDYAAFVESSFICLSIMGLLYFRWKKPDAHRPVKVFLPIPIFFLVICLFLVIFPVVERVEEVGVAVLITSLGIPIYCFAVLWRSKPQCIKRFHDITTVQAQKLFLSLPQDDYDGDEDDDDENDEEKKNNEDLKRRRNRKVGESCMICFLFLSHLRKEEEFLGSLASLFRRGMSRRYDGHSNSAVAKPAHAKYFMGHGHAGGHHGDSLLQQQHHDDEAIIISSREPSINNPRWRRMKEPSPQDAFGFNGAMSYIGGKNIIKAESSTSSSP